MKHKKNVFSIPETVWFSNDTSLFRLCHFTVEEHLPISMGQYSFFLYVTEGEGVIYVNGSSVQLCTGSLCHLHTYHFFEIYAAEGLPLKFVGLSYDYLLWSYLFVYEYDPIFNETHPPYCPVIHPQQELKRHISSLFSNLEKEEKHNDAQSVLIKSSFIGQLNIIFRQQLLNEIEEGNAVSLPLAGKIIDYIYVYTTDISSSKSCAEYFKISTNTLNRELISATGHRFAWHIKRARLNKAISYMFFTDISYRSVASMAGFSSECEFYKVFKELLGTTPRNYRELMINSENGYQHLANVDSVSIVAYMIENYRDHLTLKGVSDHFHISAKKLNQLLITSYADNYHAILSRIQLEKAKKLLKICDFPCVDIAMYCGYNSAATFLRVFQKAFGISPNEYRKKIRGEITVE